MKPTSIWHSLIDITRRANLSTDWVEFWHIHLNSSLEEFVSRRQKNGRISEFQSLKKIYAHFLFRYNDVGYNLRVIATHQIGHVLGLDHSNDESSIMFPYYRLMQPRDLLSNNVSNHVLFKLMRCSCFQSLLGPRSSSNIVRKAWTDDGAFKY
jgi:hypothetical protein